MKQKKRWIFLEPHIDAYNIDLKSFSENFIKKICRAKLPPVLETSAKYAGPANWLEITTLLVPGENDSEKEIRQIAGFIKKALAGYSMAFIRFFIRLLNEFSPAAPPETVVALVKSAAAVGLKYVYAGNISSGKNQATVLSEMVPN